MPRRIDVSHPTHVPAEMATPILRGDILSAPLLAGALRRGPSSAWRVLRPFVRGGGGVAGSAEPA